MHSQVSIDNLCEAFTFELERTVPHQNDVKPAISAVRKVLAAPASENPETNP